MREGGLNGLLRNKYARWFFLITNFSLVQGCVHLGEPAYTQEKRDRISPLELVLDAACIQNTPQIRLQRGQNLRIKLCFPNLSWKKNASSQSCLALCRKNDEKGSRYETPEFLDPNATYEFDWETRIADLGTGNILQRTFGDEMRKVKTGDVLEIQYVLTQNGKTLISIQIPVTVESADSEQSPLVRFASRE